MSVKDDFGDHTKPVPKVFLSFGGCLHCIRSVDISIVRVTLIRHILIFFESESSYKTR